MTVISYSCLNRKIFLVVIVGDVEREVYRRKYQVKHTLHQIFLVNKKYNLILIKHSFELRRTFNSFTLKQYYV